MQRERFGVDEAFPIAELDARLAELLADNGVAVEVISPQLLLGEDLLKSLDMPHVFPRIVAKGVKLTPQELKVRHAIAVIGTVAEQQSRELQLQIRDALRKAQ